ncbi:preprotein translocase subunit SecD [Candidatus Hakubella thermalkaliphila]|uniref:Protein translocase subunit SecD n=3 Tax=Candidatus Hakubella thermalkaliphila TaxID=2754717 RepID=A0A6V8NRU8_9ACTN|nr:protein translocase subunit SecD [Candidatus Hakubella thermalkaliphila]GFP19606.1 preprotein translocase subunit SecD [Candidatus Hakubella thermalkaliphila]GFP22763.1 preprotein translocase subunit SecD [Candidatus Hakubella thermalkaliphila]GFP38839.1 preprotein translocase subunit SecD [Candidatus Hakubella thermalkaliphila]GFP42322.1 preprotein translocase subunit SecD [Candidatus Hakubella thermalkaliphila]
MNRRRKNLLILAFVVILVGVSLYHILTISTRLGLDLRGGTRVILTAADETGEGVSEEKMEKAMLIIQDRVDQLGVSEPEINRVIGTGSIVVALPDVADPQKAIDIIGKTAQLEFRILEEFDEEDKPVFGSVLMRGDMLRDASAGYDPDGKIIVSMTFTPEGADRFYEITSQNVGRRLAIVLDGEMKSAPVIKTAIRGEAVIENIDSLEEAKNIALVLKTGALPVNLEVEEVRVISATLGLDSLQQGIRAGIIGIILVILFMLVYYAGLGGVVFAALVIYGVLFWGVLVGLRAALTLPGIAGMILTIGMAVDANIIIYERIKEEIRKGKTIRTSIAEGFKYGLRAILDANVTTLITAAVLFYFGTGPIRGFATTLSLGVLISMFTALVFTRSLLELLVDFKAFLRPGFFGVRKQVS